MDGKRYGRYLIGLVAVAVALFAMAAPAMAASSVTVNAEVQAEAYSISLSDGSNLDYDALDVSTSGYPLDAHKITVNNIGTEAVRLDMLGSDPSNGSGGSWAMRSNTDADQCAWNIINPSPYAQNFVTSLSSTEIEDSLASGSSLTCDALFYMPTSTTGSGHYYWTGTIYASAAL